MKENYTYFYPAIDTSTSKLILSYNYTISLTLAKFIVLTNYAYQSFKDTYVTKLYLESNKTRTATSNKIYCKTNSIKLISVAMYYNSSHFLVHNFDLQ